MDLAPTIFCCYYWAKDWGLVNESGRAEGMAVVDAKVTLMVRIFLQF